MDTRYFVVVCGRRLIQLDHLRGNIMMSTTEAILAQGTAIAVWRFCLFLPRVSWNQLLLSSHCMESSCARVQL